MIGKTISHYKILETAGGSGISICAFLLSLVIVVSGCGRSDTSIKLPGGAKVGDVKLEHFTYKTSGSAFKADRGVIVLPENRKKVGSRLIALPFVRIHTPISKPAEPIFFLSGGPGSPNIQNEAPGWVDSLLVNHDFVMVGYRGAEGSTILDCPEVKRALKGADDDLLSPESRAKLIEAMSSSAKRLQNEGIDISGYTIEEVAEDLDAVRFALDCERVSLLSMSYGTRVAQVYSYLHQDHLRRSVMVGANPPGHFVWEPKRIDEQLQQYSRLWEKDSVQAKRTNNLAETIHRVSHDMPKHWLFFPIDRGKVRVVTFSLLFHRNTAAMAFDAYAAAEKGDHSGLALMSMAYDFIVPSIGIWGDFFSKGSTDYDSSRDYASEMDPPGSIIGSPMSLLIWPAAAASGSWPMVLLPDSIRLVQP